MKILVVDDNEKDRKFLKVVLEGRNCSVVEAADGREGVELALAHKPDLIISDAMMPAMDGFQFLRRVRSDETLRSIPFVFYSAFYTGDREAELARLLGANAYIVKPKSPADFWLQLSTVVEDCRTKKEKSAGALSVLGEEEYLREYTAIVCAKLEEKVIELGKENERRLRAEESLRRSGEEYRLLFESNPLPMWVYDLETLSFLAVNDAAVRQYGYSRDEFLSMTIADIRPSEEVHALRDNVSRITEGLGMAGVWRHRRMDGSVVLVEISSHTLIFSGRRAEIVMSQDVTERIEAEAKVARQNRIYSMLSKINEAIVRIRERDALLSAVCRISVDVGFFRMVWIGLINPDARLVKPVAHCGFEEGYLDTAILSVGDDVQEGRGPGEAALRAGTLFVCNDIEHAECMLPWRDEALKRGYRSSACFPLIMGGLFVTGLISFYSSEPHFFDDEEIRLLREVTGDISFALEFMEKEDLRRRAEADLKERVEELEKFYDMAVGRELKMKELKTKIETLETELSRRRKGP